jgi:hypothetical protein
VDTRASVSTEQIVFASAISGAYASAAIALLFLGLDIAQGVPLFTPSLMGSVVLLGEVPSASLAVRLDMVALYSLVHFAAFVALGGAASLAFVRWQALRRHPLVPAGLIMALLMVGAIAVELLVAPGLLSAIGPGAVAVGNASAAGVMGWFIHSALRPEPSPVFASSGSGDTGRSS